MSDDERIAELFRAAASDASAPPPGFDHTDVVTASRRITARRRSAVLGGFALLAVVGVGAGVVVPGLTRQEATTSAAAPVAAPEAARQAGDAAGAAAPDALSGVAPFTGTPLGPGATECADRQDPAVRALVEQVLPEVAGAAAAATTDVCLPGGERGVNLEVDDHGTAGLLTVSYLPPGTIVTPAAGFLVLPTGSGGTVLVGARGTGPGTAVPFQARLPAVAAYLAPRL